MKVRFAGWLETEPVLTTVSGSPTQAPAWSSELVFLLIVIQTTLPTSVDSL